FLFLRLQRGILAPVPEDQVFEMFQTTREVLTDAGYEQYEIANFARPGHACRHNLIYWNNEPYLGFGPGAHSYWWGRRTANEKDPAVYAARLSAGRLPVVESEVIDRRTEMAETMFLGLRLRRGVALELFRKRFGCDLQDVYGAEIARLEDQGFLEVRDGRVRITERGLPLADLVFEAFI
ncbi:MAG: coproporphyrinogen III oxidase, partial [Candidatus Desulforudis sp.]|nr:coproporphyrinogen III oxidase [Desulforudis sp.]